MTITTEELGTIKFDFDKLEVTLLKYDVEVGLRKVGNNEYEFGIFNDRYKLVDKDLYRKDWRLVK